MRITVIFLLLFFSKCATDDQRPPKNDSVKKGSYKVIKTESKEIFGFVTKKTEAAGYLPLRLTTIVTFDSGEEIKFENPAQLPDDMVGKYCRIKYDRNTIENSSVRNIVRDLEIHN